MTVTVAGVWVASVAVTGAGVSVAELVGVADVVLVEVVTGVGAAAGSSTVSMM